MQEKKQGKKGGKKREQTIPSKSKQVRRKRSGPKNHERQAICRAINVSTRPDITRGLLTHRVYEQIDEVGQPGTKRNGKLLRRFVITRAAGK